MNEVLEKKVKSPKITPQPTRHHYGDIRNAFEQEMNVDIVQIIPAVGWRAVFLYDDGELEIIPLVCWAIYDNPDVIGREIKACVVEDGTVTVVDENWKGLAVDFLAPGQCMPKSWKRQTGKKKVRSQGRIRSMADKVFGGLYQWA